MKMLVGIQSFYSALLHVYTYTVGWQTGWWKKTLFAPFLWPHVWIFVVPHGRLTNHPTHSQLAYIPDTGREFKHFAARLGKQVGGKKKLVHTISVAECLNFCSRTWELTNHPFYIHDIHAVSWPIQDREFKHAAPRLGHGGSGLANRLVEKTPCSHHFVVVLCEFLLLQEADHPPYPWPTGLSSYLYTSVWLKCWQMVDLNNSGLQVRQSISHHGHPCAVDLIHILESIKMFNWCLTICNIVRISVVVFFR